MKELEPKMVYFSTDNLLKGVDREGPFRKIEQGGRSGINATSIHSRLMIPKHTVNERQGSLTFWVMPIETMYSTSVPFFIMPYEPLYYMYTLLSDITDMKNVTEANFALLWNSDRFRQVTAKFYKGNIFEDGLYPDMALSSSGDNVTLEDKNWYQMGVSWDRDKGVYLLYVNGMAVGSSSLFASEVLDNPCGEVLYAGNPTFALSSLSFYDRVLDKKDMAQAFKKEAAYINPAVQEALLDMQVGSNLKKYTWEPLNDDWKLKVDVPFTNPEDFDLFHVQGCPTTPRITDKGLLYETHMTRTESAKVPKATVPPAEIDDPDQVYLWTKEFFEGDIAVEYDFMPLQKNGLSVLMIQASGMQHEDFMADYPLRKSGSMRVVWGENCRNYDWEYWREMDDIRHDTESHVLNKNPWGYQLAYQCQPKLWEHNVWHHIQLVQEGQRIRGTIDGVLIFDTTDDPYIQQGPTLNCGRVAIRCMWKTRLLVKDLKIYNKPMFENAVEL
jgi:hypothetical protein